MKLRLLGLSGRVCLVTLGWVGGLRRRWRRDRRNVPGRLRPRPRHLHAGDAAFGARARDRRRVPRWQRQERIDCQPGDGSIACIPVISRVQPKFAANGALESLAVDSPPLGTYAVQIAVDGAPAAAGSFNYLSTSTVTLGVLPPFMVSCGGTQTFTSPMKALIAAQPRSAKSRLPQLKRSSRRSRDPQSRGLPQLKRSSRRSRDPQLRRFNIRGSLCRGSCRRCRRCRSPSRGRFPRRRRWRRTAPTRCCRRPACRRRLRRASTAAADDRDPGRKRRHPFPPSRSSDTGFEPGRRCWWSARCLSFGSSSSQPIATAKANAAASANLVIPITSVLPLTLHSRS